MKTMLIVLLFYRTDYFIDMLDIVYEHYDAFGSKTKGSSDGKFTSTINILKILR